MTVKLEGTIKRFIGSITDTKPYPGMILSDGYEVTANDLRVGSSFLAIDTATGIEEIYHWNGREWAIGDSREVRELKAIKSLLGIIAEKLGTPGL